MEGGSEGVWQKTRYFPGFFSGPFPKMHPSEIESGHFCLFSNTYRLADAGGYALQVRYFLLLYWFSVRNLSEPFKEQ